MPRHDAYTDMTFSVSGCDTGRCIAGFPNIFISKAALLHLSSPIRSIVRSTMFFHTMLSSNQCVEQTIAFIPSRTSCHSVYTKDISIAMIPPPPPPRPHPHREQFHILHVLSNISRESPFPTLFPNSYV